MNKAELFLFVALWYTYVDFKQFFVWWIDSKEDWWQNFNWRK